MFALFKRKKENIIDTYEDIVARARDIKLYTDYGVEDNPAMRFQMIALHAAPYFMEYATQGEGAKSQALFDKIFADIELSFREIGVGDLAVPKRMKKYMKDFNGVIQAHAAANADHAMIASRNVFNDDAQMSPEFKKYIEELF